ncbi:acyl-CoA dehydrogenase family protein [Sphingobium sp. AS12]|uniref:acyl-CoA dehydrogenase family protein n=1 Tax=Sphingobium sp. AS12 TaxID=2849495 RepID=UPI001C3133BD|nr:acyl-CoA dehydrogenase family protein [Sphingobium sp. AS12]MBV2149108.1 acyl-CoA dehydrogenase family protein [Sphingobium sp. AS12]
MKLIEDPSLDRFRDECRAWLNDNVPRNARPSEGLELRAYDMAWQRTQFEGGWAGVSWPKAFGGRGLSVLEQLIWHEEYARAGARTSASMFVALSHAGPTLIVQGSEDQKSRHLPAILKGEETWCQGFSEPGAGSDLAALKTRAVIDGDHLVVSGTKIWTSYAQGADYQELLVRTDPDLPRHRGISWVICDMTLPGIEVRPITTMTGYAHFAQIFYDEVRIPMTNLVGQLNGGWGVAMTTLGFERGTGTIAHQIELANTVERLITTAKETYDRATGKSLFADAAVASRLAVLRAEVAALRSLTVASVSRGMREEIPGAEGNIPALYFGELTRRVNGAVIDLLGPGAMARGGSHNLPKAYLESFKWAIGGGTSEIRRNTIGERVLGLPKGPRAI